MAPAMHQGATFWLNDRLHDRECIQALDGDEDENVARQVGNRRVFVILNHAHRQIHAEDAGGVAGGAGLGLAG